MCLSTPVYSQPEWPINVTFALVSSVGFKKNTCKSVA